MRIRKGWQVGLLQSSEHRVAESALFNPSRVECPFLHDRGFATLEAWRTHGQEENAVQPVCDCFKPAIIFKLRAAPTGESLEGTSMNSRGLGTPKAWRAHGTRKEG